MPPSTPFRPPRSARAPALESAVGAKRAAQNSPQTASTSAYGTINSAVAASPGAARVEKLKDESEQLMMQLGCVHSAHSSRRLESSDSPFPLCGTQRSGSRSPVRPRRGGRGERRCRLQKCPHSRCGSTVRFLRRRVATHEKAQREARSD